MSNNYDTIIIKPNYNAMPKWELFLNSTGYTVLIDTSSGLVAGSHIKPYPIEWNNTCGIIGYWSNERQQIISEKPKIVCEYAWKHKLFKIE